MEYNRTGVNTVSIPASTSVQEILGPRPNRRGLILMSDATFNLTYGINFQPTNLKGIVLWGTNPPLHLDAGTYGDSMQGAVNVISSGAGIATAVEFLDLN